MYSEERESYFDRPLKEVGVGESPSRAWGISRKHISGPTPELKSTLPSETDKGAFNKQALDVVESQPHVVFDGLVSIDYPLEEAVAFLKQSGIGKRG